MKATVYNIQGEKVKEVDLNPAIFGVEIKPELVQQAVVVSQANKRQVFAHAKDRSEVSGGGRKPWKQKGTGRARHGSSRSPIWRGGGITFGPSKVRNFSLKMNKKAKRKAVLMSLSDKAINEKIILLDKLELEQAKTKKFFEILQNVNLREKKAKKKSTTSKDEKNDKDKIEKKAKPKKVKSVLLVLSKKAENIQRAAKNIPRLITAQASSLNILDILKHQYLLMPLDSIAEIEKNLGSSKVSSKVKSADKK